MVSPYSIWVLEVLLVVQEIAAELLVIDETAIEEIAGGVTSAVACVATLIEVD